MVIILFLAVFFLSPSVGQELNLPARITGRVVAADTGLPLRGAVVELRGGWTQSVVAEADGRFEFSERKVGVYTLRASKAGYVASVFGGEPYPANQFDVIAGQQIDRGDIRLQRASVISGRVVDESGEPVADARVIALRIEFPQPGIRSWQTIKEVPTNDLGEYRIPGLMPGQYHVTAGRLLLPPEFRSLAEEMAVMQITQGSVASARSYSEPIVVSTVHGGETGGMNVTLQRARQVRISGSVVDSNGRPAMAASVTLRLAQSLGSPVDAGGAQARTKAGEFVFTNVPVGEYRLTASADVLKGPVVPSRGGAAIPIPAHESASMSLSITDDISSLTVHTTPGKAVPPVTGRVFIDGAPAEKDIRLRLVILPAGQQPMVSRESAAGSIMSTLTMSTLPSGRPGPGGTFNIPVAASLIVLRLAGSPELSLKSVTANGLDGTDGFEVTQSAGGTIVDVHLTAHGPVLQGTVKDADGSVAGRSDVVLFSVDPASWKVPLTRRVATVRADEKGAFQINSLPSGQYLAVALADLDRAMWADPDRLERLRAFATPFSLTDGASTHVALQVKR